MSNIGFKLGIQGVQQVQSGLNQVNTSLGRLTGSADAASAAIGGRLVGAFASVLSADALARFAKHTIDSVDALNDAADATGSTVEQLARLERVARLNGGTLDTVTGAVVKFNAALKDADGKNAASLALEAIGLNAEKLKALDPAQALQEVAQALDGFADDGTKARITQELFGKSLREVAPLLKDMVENGGAVSSVTGEMARQSEILNKEIFKLRTNLGDLSRDEFQRLVPLMTEIVRGMNDAADGTTLFTQAGGALQVFLETISVLGANVSFTFQGVGREIGAIAAQINALSSGNIRGFVEIARQLRIDNDLARKELEKFEARVFNPGKRDAGGGRGFIVPEAVKPSAEDPAAIKARKDALEALFKVEEARAKLEREQLAARDLKRQLEYDKAEEAITEALAKAKVDLEEAIYKSIDASFKEVVSLEQTVKALELENEAIGLNGVALAELTAARLRATAADKEMQGTAANDEALIRQAELLRKQADLVVANAAKKANLDAAQDAADEWKKSFEQIGQSLTDELMRGGKNAGRLLRDYFKTLILQPIIKAVTNPLASAISGTLGSVFGLTSAPAQAGQAGNAFSGLSSLSGLGSALGAFGSSFSAGFSSTIASGFATTGLALEGGLAMVAEGTMASMAAGFGQIAGALGPYASAAAALYGIYKSLDKSGTPHRGGEVSSIGAGFTAIDSFGANRLVQTEATLGPLAEASAKVLNLMSMLGGGANDLAVRLSFAADGVDESIGKLTIGGATKDLRFSNNIEQAMKEFQGELGIGLRTAILGMDLPKWIKDQWQMLRLDATVEDVVKLAEAINIQVTETRALKAAFDGLPGSFAVVANLPDELRLKIAQMFGGAQNAIQAANAYFQEFYSDTERTAAATQRMNAAFAALGLEVPKSREAFRALVDSLSLADDNSRATYAALIQLAPAFAELNPVLEQTADAARSLEDIARERLGLERELLQLQGNTAELRRRELEALDPSNRELLKQIFALEDAQAAQESYNRALADARSALDQAKQAVAAAQSDVDGIRDQATSNYLNALEKVDSIQQRIADQARAVAVEYGRLADDLFGYLDQQSKPPSMQFADALKAALAGDQNAMRALPGLADTNIQAASDNASTAVEAVIGKARILADVQKVAEAANAKRAAEVDEAKNLQDELKAAQKDLADALKVANAIQAPLVRSQEDLIAKFAAAQTALQTALADQAKAQAALDAIVTNTALANVVSREVAQAIIGRLSTGFAALDANRSGSIDFREFSAAFSGLASEQTLRTLFELTDTNHDGVIDKLEAIRLAVISTKGGALAGPATYTADEVSKAIRTALSQGFTPEQILQGAQANFGASEAQIIDLANAAGIVGFTNVTRTTGGASSAARPFLDSQVAAAIEASLAAGFDPAQIKAGAVANFGADVADIERIAREAGIPGFFTGGVFTNGIVTRPTMFDMGLMGEKGREAIMPLANIGGSLGVRAAMPSQEELIAEMQAMRQELAMLRREAQATAVHTEKTADLLVRATDGGNDYFQTKVAA